MPDDQYGIDRLMGMIDVASWDDPEWHQTMMDITETALTRKEAYELFLRRRFANGIGAIALLLLRQDEVALDKWRDY